jgi:hypothetical protein
MMEGSDGLTTHWVNSASAIVRLHNNTIAVGDALYESDVIQRKLLPEPELASPAIRSAGSPSPACHQTIPRHLATQTAASSRAPTALSRRHARISLRLPLFNRHSMSPLPTAIPKH